jgi:glycosyltransferase involved in cell wall biosynthesis
MDDISISIILPVHNQADHIGRVVQQHVQALTPVQKQHELLLVVNGPCRDDSLATCRALAERDSHVRVVHSVEGGWGLAVRKGLAEARGRWIGYTNAARTTPEDLAAAVRLATEHPDYVVKAKRQIRENLVRRVGSLLYNLECRLLFGLSWSDVNGTPKIFPRHMRRLLELTRNDDLIDAEFCMICHREKYPMLETPVFAFERHGGTSTTGLRSALGMYRGAWQLWHDYRGVMHG